MVYSNGTIYNDMLLPAYGPLELNLAIPTNLTAYALSLSWHSKAQDPTGLILMGDRYYDSKNGQFLSQDPISYPTCLDLYTYANGDPINYFDPNGRFASAVYKPIVAAASDIWNNPCFHGGLQFMGGIGEMSMGAGITFGSYGTASPVGLPILMHGLDHALTGARTVFTGQYHDSTTSLLLQKAGMSASNANFVDSVVSIISMGVGSCIQRGSNLSRLDALSSSSSRSVQLIEQRIPNYKPFNKYNYRHNLMEFTGINPSSTTHAHHVFLNDFKKNFSKKVLIYMTLNI